LELHQRLALQVVEGHRRFRSRWARVPLALNTSATIVTPPPTKAPKSAEPPLMRAVAVVASATVAAS